MQKINLPKMRYPGNSYESYYLPYNEAKTLQNSSDSYELSISGAVSGPKVAVLMAIEKHPDRNEPDYYVPEFYVKALTKYGATPYFVTFDEVEKQLNMIQPRAFLLIGGDFAFPSESIIGSQPQTGSLHREQAYETCIAYAHRNYLPILGICAGEQVLAVTNHARLQAVENHRCQPDQKSHCIKIMPDTLLSRITSLQTAEVNSNHHLAVSPDNLGDLRISAVAEDGTVEAVEPLHNKHWFELGVQWHPERFIDSDDQLTNDIFSIFYIAARGTTMIDEDCQSFASADMIEINDRHFIIDLIYASPENLTQTDIYSQVGLGKKAYVRRELWERLQQAIPYLEAHNLKMKICDAYRPPLAHKLIQETLGPQGAKLFAARPVISKHCHGTAVDVLLTDINGNNLIYPTPIDVYSKEYAHQIKNGNTQPYLEACLKAKHNYCTDISAQAIRNREELLRLMTAIGLQPYRNEWWHYEMPDEFNFTFPMIEF